MIKYDQLWLSLSGYYQSILINCDQHWKGISDLAIYATMPSKDKSGLK